MTLSNTSPKARHRTGETEPQGEGVVESLQVLVSALERYDPRVTANGWIAVEHREFRCQEWGSTDTAQKVHGTSLVYDPSPAEGRRTPLVADSVVAAETSHSMRVQLVDSVVSSVVFRNGSLGVQMTVACRTHPAVQTRGTTSASYRTHPAETKNGRTAYAPVDGRDENETDAIRSAELAPRVPLQWLLPGTASGSSEDF
jgi:hypothetical protein